jgi:hypothetical protein
VRNALVVALTLFAVALMCVPLLRAPLVGDDLQVLSQALPELQRGGFWGVLEARLAGNANFQHFLPVAGLFEALHVWFSVTLAEVTPLSVSNMWGLLRVGWLIVALAAATFTAVSWRRVWPGLSPIASGNGVLHVFATLALIGAATVQVHGPWNHDAVLSYNAYAWPSVVFSLVYLGLVGRMLTSTSTSRRAVVGAVLAASAAVLTYELSLAAVVAAGVAAVLALGLSRMQGRPWRRIVRQAAVLLPVVLIPLIVLAIALSLRDESTQVYPGTQVRFGVRAFFTWIFGLLSALPFVAWPRGLAGYGEPTFVSRTVLASGVGFVITVVVALLSRRNTPPAPASVPAGPAWTSLRAAWTVPVAMLCTYWAAATAIHAITPKYQDEINYTLGNTYLFYAVGFVCVALILQSIYASATRWLGTRAVAVIAVPCVVLGLYQSAYNTQLTSNLRATQNFSFAVVASATERLPEADRCLAWDTFADAQARNPPLVAAVAEAFDEYQEEFGEPYCGRGLLTEGLSGVSYREYAAGQPDFWWLTSPDAVFRVSRYPGSEATPSAFSLTLGKPPCATSRSVVVDTGVERKTVEIGPDQGGASAQLLLPVGFGTIDVRVSSSGPACRVGSDPRDLFVQVEAATTTASR